MARDAQRSKLEAPELEAPRTLTRCLRADLSPVLVRGCLPAQVVGLPSLLGSTSTWPIMLAMVLPIALLQLLLQPSLLESPRWYAMYGNERMAEEQLVLLRDRDPHDEELLEELYCMLTAVVSGAASRVASRAAFHAASRARRRPFVEWNGRDDACRYIFRYRCPKSCTWGRSRAPHPSRPSHAPRPPR